MIKTILFDMGGVVITLAQPQAIERFKALGLKDAEQRLDAYTQQGIFGDLESGRLLMRFSVVNSAFSWDANSHGRSVYMRGRAIAAMCPSAICAR